MSAQSPNDVTIGVAGNGFGFLLVYTASPARAEGPVIEGASGAHSVPLEPVPSPSEVHRVRTPTNGHERVREGERDAIRDPAQLVDGELVGPSWVESPLGEALCRGDRKLGRGDRAQQGARPATTEPDRLRSYGPGGRRRFEDLAGGDR